MILLSYINTKDQLADILTKVTTTKIYVNLISQLLC
jgi:hypothetical protein